MKKTLLMVFCGFFGFGAGLGLNNLAFSDTPAIKIAYVNVGQLLSASKTLKSAEEAKTKSTQEMLNWYNTASADIKKQSTQQGRDTLIKKYEAQLTQKKKTIKDAYVKKVNEVDKQLDATITQKAKALGYTIVLRKDSVLFGGDDITSQILPSVK